MTTRQLTQVVEELVRTLERAEHALNASAERVRRLERKVSRLQATVTGHGRRMDAAGVGRVTGRGR